MNEHVIPVITDPMGRHWQQPPHERVLVDETHAIVAKRDFDELLDYSNTIPDGKYVGKMWRREHARGKWLLCWYGPHVDPKSLSINYRELLVLE